MRGIKSYVLRAGRMSAAQRRSYEELGPRYCLGREDGEEQPAGSAGWFGGADCSHPLVIEIGFGMGDATARIAEENPGINYLGIEVHRPGIGRLLWEIEKRNLANVRIIEGDAAEVLALEKIPENAASGFHIFFPDPWPKKRHHKRRLITRPFTDLLASRLKEGGYVYMVTDWADYGDWALRELGETPGLQNPYKDAPHGGFAPPQPWRPRTKFESRGITQNHEIRELYFIKPVKPAELVKPVK